MEEGKPESRRRIETQILHRHPEGWRAYTYQWNEEGSDAELVAKDGTRRVFTIRDPAAPGGQRSQRWEFLSRANCFSCHNGRGGTARALNAAQWNRTHRYPGDLADNQLGVLTRLGLVSAPLDPGIPPAIDPHDRTASLESRARTYLHYNCSFCHRPNGGGLVPIHLSRGQSLERLGVGATPQRGDFGLADAKVIAPGEPLKSVLYYRMAKLGSGRMPHLASARVDVKGLELIHEWIRAMPRNDGPRQEMLVAIAAADSPAARKALVDELLATADGALALMRALDQDSGLTGKRSEIALQVAGSTAPAHVRDLFDRFLPDDRRMAATSKDPSKILALEGDPERGLALLTGPKGTGCLTCHLHRGEGRDIGPPFSQIGGKLTRSQLLESLLQPSRTIAEGYAGYAAILAEGTAVVGRLLSRSPGGIVIRDLAGQDRALDPRDVKQLELLPNSLMPVGLLGPMSDQEVADLVAYLASVRGSPDSN